MQNNIDAEVDKIMSENNTSKPKKKRTKKKKVIISIIIIIFILFIISNIIKMRKASIISVDSDILSKGHIEDVLLVSGPVGGTDSVTITSGIHGKITEINVKEGDEVIENKTILAKIDTRDLKTRLETARGQYKLAIAQKEDKIKNDTIAYTKAHEALRLANLDYERKKELADSGLISQSELEVANNALISAKADINQYTLKNGKIFAGETYDIQIENAKLELERLEQEFENATLIAPISGTVTRVFAKVGRFADQPVNNNPTLITIEKLDKLELNLSISEYNIGKVKIGQDVLISADILGKGNEIRGKVEKISPSGEEKSDASSNERVIPVKVSIENKGKLISGINAKAKIINDQKDNVYTVPISAIGDDGAGKFKLQLIEAIGKGKGKIKTIPIKTGIEGDVNIEILEDSFKDFDKSKEIRYLLKYNPDLKDGVVVNYSPAQFTEETVKQDKEDKKDKQDKEDKQDKQDKQKAK